MNQSSERGFPARSLARALKTAITANSLERYSGPQIMSRWGREIKTSLTDDSSKQTTVLVCARNEVRDLPRLGYALSKQSNVRRLRLAVVDNNSTDGTQEMAKDLGATVINESATGLIFALMAGFKFLHEHPAWSRTTLLTDADSFPVATWAREMINVARKITESTNKPTQVYGPISFFGGDQIRNILLSARSLHIDHKFWRKNGVIAHGPNSAIVMTEDSSLEPLVTLDRNVVTGTDCLVRDTFRSRVGKVIYNPNLDSLVLTRGDRYPNIFRILITKYRFSSHHRQLYASWYEGRDGGRRYIGRP